MSIRRGDIYYANLDPVRGSEQAGRRPVLVIQNDVGNEHSPTIIIAPLTTKRFSKEYPTNVFLKRGAGALKEDSTVLLSQIRTVDRERLERKIGSISGGLVELVDEAIKISLGVS